MKRKSFTAAQRLKCFEDHGATLQQKFEARYVPEPNSGCWLWDGAYVSGPGASQTRGYLRHDHKKITASRASYMIFNGPIPKGLWVLHKCDVSLCVNPRHLYLGEARDNSRDMVTRGRAPRGEHHKLSKLSDVDITAIREDRRSTRTLTKLYHVHKTTIKRVRRRST